MIVATQGSDNIVASESSDLICSLGGNDRLLGNRGDDTWTAGPVTTSASAARAPTRRSTAR